MSPYSTVHLNSYNSSPVKCTLHYHEELERQNRWDRDDEDGRVLWEPFTRFKTFVWFAVIFSFPIYIIVVMHSFRNQFLFCSISKWKLVLHTNAVQKKKKSIDHKIGKSREVQKKNRPHKILCEMRQRLLSFVVANVISYRRICLWARMKCSPKKIMLTRVILMWNHHNINVIKCYDFYFECASERAGGHLSQTMRDRVIYSIRLQRLYSQMLHALMKRRQTNEQIFIASTTHQTHRYEVELQTIYDTWYFIAVDF